MYEKLGNTAKYIQSIKKVTPQVGVVLGSGLGAFVDRIEDPTVIPYSEIPGFYDCTVEGHTGRLILGKVKGVEVAVLQGRIHAYEGHPMEDIVFPTRVLAILGIETLLLTNAAGGINKAYAPGDLVIIEDHINMMAKNPLIGPNIAELGPRFPDMTQAYNPEVREILATSAQKIGLKLHTGVYAGMLGPTYETPAEVKMMGICGADMVGMSTVPESIAANHLGIKVGGISCITNMAAGIQGKKLSHDDIKEQAVRVMNDFSNLLEEAIEKIGSMN
ncbi:MAG: purine-nucleoside phosphorylase [Deltaproteobacteria bacterium]|nr:MAG: purine-nucleoside phosphorylase [Deltaproteobacteria bacterium]TNF29702.1 MAG: purine-nucleoside phosphorylase [Deltaproteobacteria bacterium]